MQDRLVASGGVLGEDGWSGTGARAPGLSATPPIGRANLWVRGFDQFGSASASGSGVGHNVNRAAPFIGGVDWRLDNGFVVGARGQLCGDLRRLQGRLAHRCELV